MIWQKGKVDFFSFFALFVPSLINWLVPAVCMSLTVPKGKPQVIDTKISMKMGAKRIMVLFLLTIVTAVSFHNFLHLPPAVGMMLGMGYLSLFAYYLSKVEGRMLSGDNPSTSPDTNMRLSISSARWRRPSGTPCSSSTA